MSFKSFSLVLYLFSLNAFAKQQTSVIPNVDHIFNGLSKQQWDADEMPCRDRIFDILEGVKNSTLWATWVWNSIEQAPTGLFFGARHHMGAYDQCLRPPWLSSHPELRTQYCLAQIEMNGDGVKTMEQVTDPYVRAEEYYIDTKTHFGRSFSYIAHGVCLPAVCPSKSAEKFVRALLSTGYLRAARDAAVSIHRCEQAGEPHQYTTGFYVYICTFAALFAIAVASTYYVNAYPTCASSDYFANRIATSFNIKTNWDTIVKKSTTGDLTHLNGIQFLSSVMLCFLHLLTITMMTSVINGLDLEMLSTHHVLKYFVFHGDLITDIFLAISALWLGKNLSMLNIMKPCNILECILMRYLRLIGVLAVVVFYAAHVLLHTGNGPVYAKVALEEQQACEKNWWLTLLLVANYFNFSEMCIQGTWQVCCDFQLFILTLFLLYFYRKNPRMGKVAITMLLVLMLLSPAINIYVYDLPVNPLFEAGIDLFNVRENRYLKYVYVRSHNRVGPYIIGLIVGYFMSMYKPKDYQKVWSKTKSIIGVGACLFLMIAVLSTGWWFLIYNVRGPLAYAFMTIDRTAFTVGFLGFVVICTYGDVPLVKTFLGWPAFAPLSRLSYGLNLIHMMIEFRKFSMKSHMTMHLFDMFTETLGVVVVSLVLSLCVWLLVEAPLFNISSRYFKKNSTKKEVTTNETHQDDTNKQKMY